MPFRFFDHTADLAVELTAATAGALCEEALAAFTEILTERERIMERVERRFALAAPALDLLLVDWLGELLYAFEVEGLLFRRAEAEVREEADGGVRLAAVAWGEPRDEARHPLKVLIKGITYHGLEVTADADGLRARVIFDI
jgi:SHS2 domain-containing protein